MNSGKTMKAKSYKTKSMKNSDSGVTSIEVRRIIKACRDNSVSRFSWNGLEVRFQEHEQENYTANNDFTQYPIEQKEKVGDNDTDNYELADNIDSVERDLEELKISDPLEYEKILQQGEHLNA